MDFQITQAGAAAVIAAGENGPRINLTSFRVGTGFGYTPLPSDTGLRGNILYTGGVNNYYAGPDPDTAIYELDLPLAEGTYSWGEVGIYTDTGVLFALATRPSVKIKEPGIITRIQAQLIFAGASAIIEFPLLDIAQAKLLELASVNQLNPPSVMDSNCYLTHTLDDSGHNMIVALRKDNSTWVFPTHPFLVVEGTVGVGSTVTNIVSADISNKVEANPVFGSYLIQFLDGALAGTVRLISAGGLNQVTVPSAFGSIPAGGSHFRIVQSSYSAASGGKVRPSEIGSKREFFTMVPPPGWLNANGAVFLVAERPLLAGRIYCGDSLNATALYGYRCNNTDGTGRSITGIYMRRPDHRGEFSRGWDNGRGVDAARNFYAWQADELKAHTHSQFGQNLVGIGYNTGGGANSNVSAATGSTGGIETRPRNLALLVCIGADGPDADTYPASPA